MPTFLLKDPTRRWVLIEPPSNTAGYEGIPQVRQERNGRVLLWSFHHTLEELKTKGYEITMLKTPVLVEDRRP